MVGHVRIQDILAEPPTHDLIGAGPEQIVLGGRLGPRRVTRSSSPEGPRHDKRRCCELEEAVWKPPASHSSGCRLGSGVPEATAAASTVLAIREDSRRRSIAFGPLPDIGPGDRSGVDWLC